MAARRLKFLQTVTNEYREKCPELSRFMMMKYFERVNGPDDEKISERSPSLNACEHCGTILTHSNCTFRIKPKQKRKKRKKNCLKNDRIFDIIPKSHNFLQICCHYCGWKTRQAGTSRKSSRNNNGTLTDLDDIQTLLSSGNVSVSNYSTPELSRTKKQSGSRSHRPSGNRKKTKSRLKELLAKEKLETDEKTSSPSLINFLATI